MATASLKGELQDVIRNAMDGWSNGELQGVIRNSMDACSNKVKDLINHKYCDIITRSI